MRFVGHLVLKWSEHVWVTSKGIPRAMATSVLWRPLDSVWGVPVGGTEGEVSHVLPGSVCLSMPISFQDWHLAASQEVGRSLPVDGCETFATNISNNVVAFRLPWRDSRNSWIDFLEVLLTQSIFGGIFLSSFYVEWAAGFNDSQGHILL